jgi:hypothetical protein
VWGKTLRDGDQNIFGIRRNPQEVICQIRGVKSYMDIARQLGIDLSRGHLFRPTTPDLGIRDSLFSSNTIKIPGYDIVRRDRDRNGGGVANNESL